MKHLLILTVGICLLISVPVMAAQAEDEAAIREVVKQGFATWNEHNPEAHQAFYVDDYENWEGTIQGRAAYEEYRAENWRRQADIQTKLLDEIGMIFVTPDAAIFKAYAETSGALDAD